MNPTAKLIAGHVAGAAAASTVFLTGVALAPGDIPTALGAVGVVGPLGIAGLSMLLQHHARTLEAAGREAHAQRRPGVQRSRVSAPTRAEVTAR